MDQQEIDELLQQSVETRNLNEEEVASEIILSDIDQNNDYSSEQQDKEMIDEINDISLSSVPFGKRDQDMSQAQSQFVDSNQLQFKKQSKNKKEVELNIQTKLSQNQQQKIKDPRSNNKHTKQIKKSATNSNTQNKLKEKQVQIQKIQKPQKKIASAIIKSKEGKPSRTKQQIEGVIKRIKEEEFSKSERVKEKKKKEMEKLKQQYDLAMMKEQERKKMNRKIYLEQKKRKKQTQNKTGQFKMEEQEGDQAAAPQKKDLLQVSQTNPIQKEKQKVDKEQALQQIKEKVNQKKNPINKQKKAQKQMEELIKAHQKKQALKLIQGDVVDKRIQFLQNRKRQLDKLQKEKQAMWKEEDTNLIKKIKEQIKGLILENKKQMKKIFEAQKTIENLKKMVKQKEKQIYNSSREPESTVYQSTPIERMLKKYNGSAEEMFRQIDVDNDGWLSKSELKNDLLGSILDKSKDGLVSLEQFVEAIERQRAIQNQYHSIMGSLTPLDVQAKIIDMKAKINFIDANTQISNDSKYIQKISKIKSLITQQNSNQTVASNDHDTLTFNKEIQMLAHECEVQKELLEVYRQTYKENLKIKNIILSEKAYENLKLKEELFLLQNQLEEYQIMQVSKQKVAQNRKGYEERKKFAKDQKEENFRKNIQYQLSLVDPTKSLKNATFSQEVKFLAAVIMIQRNYRKRKYQRQKNKKKAQ